MISNEKVKEIMGGIENRIRHAYNCGWNDGFSAMKKKVTKDIQEKIEESVSYLFEQAIHECDGCKFNGEEYPCNMCKHGFDDYWDAE